MARVVLARRARADLLERDWPLIDAIEDALGQLERQPTVLLGVGNALHGLREHRLDRGHHGQAHVSTLVRTSYDAPVSDGPIRLTERDPSVPRDPLLA